MIRPCLLAFVLSAAALAGAQEYPPLEIGAQAPDFSLPGVDGKTHSLTEFADAEVLALIFTCNHCPTAQAYEGRIKELVTAYAGKAVAIVAISPNDPLALRLDELGYTDLGDSFEDMKIRAKDENFNFQYLYDGETQEMSKKYGPVSTPHAFVFDKERELRYRGRIDNAEDPSEVETQELRTAIDSVLAGEPVAVETTKTLGCSTKWADKRPTVVESLKKWEAEPVTLEAADSAAITELVANKGENYRLITTWATWCPTCVAEFPLFIELKRMYSTRPFEIVTVSADAMDKQDLALAFLKKQHASMKNVIFSEDDSYKLIEAVDPKWEGGFPYTLIVAPGGEIVYRHQGQLDPLEIKRAIVSKLGRTYHEAVR